MTRNTIYAIALVYLCTAFFSIGNLSPDEYAQILQFAAYKLQLSQPSHMPWEFYSQIRAAIQVFPVVYLYQFFQLFTPHHVVNPFVIAFLTRLLSAALSIYAAYLFITRFQNELKSAVLKKWMILLSFFSYLVVFNSVRYSCENISGKLFIIGLCFIFSPDIRKHCRLYLHYLLCGVILGLAFYVRYEVGFMVLGLMLWLLCIKQLNIKLWCTISAGVIVSIAMGIAIDRWFYGDWVLTAWSYFSSNILQNKASSFGTSPWYDYIHIARYWPYGIVYVACTLYFIFRFRKHVITWIITPFLLVHMMVAHKEMRFMTPLLPLMPLVVMLSIQSLKNNFYRLMKAVYWQWIVEIAWYLNCAILILCVMFRSAEKSVEIYHLIFMHYTSPTILYSIGPPQHYTDEMDFYQRPNLKNQSVDHLSQIHCHKNQHCLLRLTVDQSKQYGHRIQGTLIHSSSVENWYELR